MLQIEFCYRTVQQLMRFLFWGGGRGSSIKKQVSCFRCLHPFFLNQLIALIWPLSIYYYFFWFIWVILVHLANIKWGPLICQALGKFLTVSHLPSKCWWSSRYLIAKWLQTRNLESDYLDSYRLLLCTSAKFPKLLVQQFFHQ